MSDLKRKNMIIFRYIMLALGFALQVAGFILLWRHDLMVALGVGLFIWGYSWSSQAGKGG